MKNAVEVLQAMDKDGGVTKLIESPQFHDLFLMLTRNRARADGSPIRTYDDVLSLIPSDGTKVSINPQVYKIITDELIMRSMTAVLPIQAIFGPVIVEGLSRLVLAQQGKPLAARVTLTSDEIATALVEISLSILKPDLDDGE